MVVEVGGISLLGSLRGADHREPVRARNARAAERTGFSIARESIVRFDAFSEWSWDRLAGLEYRDSEVNWRNPACKVWIRKFVEGAVRRHTIYW